MLFSIVIYYEKYVVKHQIGGSGQASTIYEEAYRDTRHQRWGDFFSVEVARYESIQIIKRLRKMIYAVYSGCKAFESISPLERRLSIFWDFNNSPIPTNVLPEDIYKNTLAFVRRKTNTYWKVDDFYAYGDFSDISDEQKVKVKVNLHNSGVTLIETPRLIKDTSYNALLVALFKRVRDRPPPYTIMLITGNIYFASTLHALRRFGHDIILAIPSGVGDSTPLINASNYNWYWSDVAKGPTSSSQVQIEELPDDNYNWYPSNLVEGEDLVPTSSSRIKELSMRCKRFIESIRPLERRLFIVWDLENCSIPVEVDAKDVFKNILAFVDGKINNNWKDISISAYAEMSRIDRKVRAYLQKSGVDLIDTPHDKKDAADEAMIIDLFMDSNYFPPPSSIMLITGDVDFANTLNALAQFGHDIFLAIPSGVVSKSLTNASKYYWSWSDVANGIEERSHVDLTGLKGQLVELLESNSGQLRLGSLATEYHKIFKKRLCPSEYKTNKLVNLLKKMSDVISVEVLNGETSVKLKG